VHTQPQADSLVGRRSRNARLTSLSLAKALGKTLAERMRSTDVSAWQKAAELAEYKAYLKGIGQPHSTRDLARLVGLPATRIGEQLTIAGELDSTSLARYAVTPEDLLETEHRSLLRVAKLPHYLREKPIRDLAKSPVHPATVPGGAAAIRESRRAMVFSRLREEGQLLIEIPAPIVSLSPGEAGDYLDEFLPALAHLAELVKGANRSHYIGLAGNGGIIIYLAPAA
jgi:hypothetical protein